MATYIRRIKMRGFKSFKHSEVELSNGFVAVAGPNGSGKSNITDAIRFAFGEMSLKSLRAKKVADLINNSCSQGEVTVYLEGDFKHEIRRTIREDCKTSYRFDGKRTTRTQVLESLRPCGYDASGHNIIAQGQVEHIIEMNAKERREIIDSVSGIAEFDDKKEEAMKNLGSVDQKINDSNIVLAERQGFLTQLEKEKDDALKYNEASTMLKRAKASLLHHEISRYEKQQTDVVSKLTNLNGEAEKLKADIATLDQRLNELGEKRAKLTEKFAKRAEHDVELRLIDQLKAQVSGDSNAAEDKRREIERLGSRVKSLDEERAGLKQAADATSADIKAAEKELASLSKELEKMERENKKELEKILGKSIAAMKEKLGSTKSCLEQGRAENFKLVSEISALRELIGARKDELSRLSGTSEAAAEHDEKLGSEISNLSKEAESLGKEVNSLWDEEKRVNKEIPEHEKKRLSLMDRAANLRVHVAPQASNPALQLIAQLREKSVVPGIYGTVAELVKFDPEHAVAIEASAGQRLQYVVVDSIDTASQAIELLKKHRAGRCTFIPIDRQLTPVSNDARDAEACSGSRGFLLGYVKFDQKYCGAMNYVFGDTLLVDSIGAAKKIGVGKARMVTFDGELIERAGIISGGSIKGSLAAKTQLEALEKEISSIDESRAALYRHLESIREEMGRKRKARAELEVKQKNFEIERAALLERGKITSEMLSNKKKIAGEVAGKEKELEDKKGALANLEAKIRELGAQEAELSSAMQQAEEKHSAELTELDKGLLELRSRIATLGASKVGAESKKKMVDDRVKPVEEERRQLAADIKLLEGEAAELAGKIAANTKTFREKEERTKELSSGIGKILEEQKRIDEEITGVGNQKGKLLQQDGQLNREVNDLNVKKATAEQKLTDLKAEFDQFREVHLIDAGKEKLNEMINSSNEALNAVGQVNLKAPERYEEERKGIEEIRSRVDKLAGEKNAVLAMIEEIETRKAGIFMEAFKVVGDNFRKLFGYIMPGEGIIALEQPSDPFNSGLIIKVRDGKHDLHLDAMSGGQKSLLALIFIFSIQMYKPAPFYILDEAEAALDKENSKKLSQLLRQLSKNTQFLVVSHNDATLTGADVVLGVSRTDDGSKIVGIQLSKAAKGSGSMGAGSPPPSSSSPASSPAPAAEAVAVQPK